MTQSMSSSCISTSSASPSQSSTQSSEMSQTSSPTPSTSSSATWTQIASSSQSSSTTATLTRSQTPSVSQRYSTSHTMTLSQRASSASVLASVSLTSAVSGSQTLTASTTQAGSATESPKPFALLTSLTTAGTPLPSEGVIVSDSLPVVPIFLWLNRCPTGNDLASAVVQCAAAAGSQLFAAVGPSAANVGASVSATLAAPCQASASTPVLLAPSAWVGVFFSSDEFFASATTVECTVTNSASGQVLASAVVPFSVLPTKWPLWEDAMSINAIGTMRSARIGIPVNATAALIDAAVATSAVGGATLESALATPAAVMLAAQRLWANSTLAPGGPSAPGFSLTLVGASRVVLRAVAGMPAFSLNSSNASVGSAHGTISAVSTDGAWAVLDTPSAAELCGSDSAECGYAKLLLSNRGTLALRGAALTCPPFCPGAVGGGVVPLAQSDGFVSLGADPDSSLGALPTIRASSVSTSEGLYYAVQCSQTGLWTDPASGACINATDPASYGCAYGSGVGCAPCPTGALCPGGSRMWSRAGFWVPSEGSTTISQCAPPNAASRCTGWSVTLGETQCGPAYLQGSFRCSACAPGYFIDESGTCEACPVVESAWQVS